MSEGQICGQGRCVMAGIGIDNGYAIRALEVMIDWSMILGKLLSPCYSLGTGWAGISSYPVTRKWFCILP